MMFLLETCKSLGTLPFAYALATELFLVLMLS
jgi:hypothetical protein